jgi:hypothetical protein
MINIYLRVLADTVASSSIILDAYTSSTLPFIKTDNSNKTTCISIGGKFMITKTEMWW